MSFVLLVYQSTFPVSVTVRHINDVTAVNQSIVTRIPIISLQHTDYARVGVKYISLNRDPLIVSGRGAFKLLKTISDERKQMIVQKRRN